jgi:hypothetical protein
MSCLIVSLPRKCRGSYVNGFGQLTCQVPNRRRIFTWKEVAVKKETVVKRKSILVAGIPALMAVFIIVALGGLYFLWRDSNKTQDAEQRFSHVCDEELIKRASSQLEANRLAELRKIEQEVRGIDSYDKDQNCLMILSRISLARNDTKASREYLEDLKKAYIPNSYSPAFTTPTLTVEEIESAIKFNEERQKAAVEEEEKMRRIFEALNNAADAAAKEAR